MYDLLSEDSLFNLLLSFQVKTAFLVLLGNTFVSVNFQLVHLSSSM